MLGQAMSEAVEVDKVGEYPFANNFTVCNRNRAKS
jgi:hypothetical protein